MLRKYNFIIQLFIKSHHGYKILEYNYTYLQFIVNGLRTPKITIYHEYISH